MFCPHGCVSSSEKKNWEKKERLGSNDMLIDTETQCKKQIFLSKLKTDWIQKVVSATDNTIYGFKKCQRDFSQTSCIPMTVSQSSVLGLLMFHGKFLFLSNHFSLWTWLWTLNLWWVIALGNKQDISWSWSFCSPWICRPYLSMRHALMLSSFFILFLWNLHYAAGTYSLCYCF